MNNENQISQLKEEIKQKDIRLDFQAVKIKELEFELQETKDDNTYLKSPLYLEDMISGIQKKYSILLNPHEVTLEETFKGNRHTYKIDVNKIICIHSEGKYKKIYFSQRQKSIEYQDRIVPFIVFKGNIEELLSIINPQKVHFCKISKSNIVNVQYYQRSGSSIKLLINIEINEAINTKIAEIQLIKRYNFEFDKVKSQYEFLLSWTKDEFRSFRNF